MFQIWMLIDNWLLRYKHMKNLNTAIEHFRCPRFWPLAPHRGRNLDACSYEIANSPPKHPCSKYEWSVIINCWDISIWKTLTQSYGNGNGNAQADYQGDNNSSPCSSYRWTKKKQKQSLWLQNIGQGHKMKLQCLSSCKRESICHVRLL